MPEPVIAAVVGVALLAALAASGRLRFLAEEIPTWPRRLIALALLWGVLVACVITPTISPGEMADVDPATIWFPSIFLGHLVLSGFLVAWWLLAWRMPLPRFLRLEGAARGDVRFGIMVGLSAWGLAIGASALVAMILLAVGHVPTGAETGAMPQLDVPPVLFWLADLPAWQKLIVVGMAMTVEEAFFRAFLQTRIGWGLSSVLFALSHGGYGLPNLTASVFVVSLAIGWAFRRRDNLLPCIVAHGIFDGVQLFVVMPLAIEHLHSLA